MKSQRSFKGILLLAWLVGLIGISAAMLSNEGRAAVFGPPRTLPGRSRAPFDQLDLIPNLETIGVVVSGASLPDTAVLMVRQSSDSVWRSGHPLVRMDDGRLAGSLFGLVPGTAYDVKVLDGSTEISGTIATQPDELQFAPSVVVYVDDDAPPGGDGSAGAPFQSIQQGVDHAGPGTRVLVADGIYHETVRFPASGSEANWIQVLAEGGGAILDGAEHLAGGIWTPHASVPGVWLTDIGGATWYLARDGERLYRYDYLSGLLAGLGHNDVPMDEGWYVDPEGSTLYVRSLDDPANHTWQVPRLNHGFDVDGRDWLWIEGFEIRFYSKEEGGQGVYLENASHVVIRHNRIHNLQGGIMINWTGGEDRGNDTRVEYNEVYDPPVNEWPWDAVKSTTMEGSGINVSGHRGAIVRANEVHHFFNGIYTGRWGDLENPEIAFDADIYDNQIHHIGDDGLEPEGTCINQRFRNNVVDTALVGISLAPIRQGPTWVLRSLFTNIDSTLIKWGVDSDGVVLIYHNTGWKDEDDENAMSIWSPVHNAVMRNNIFRGTWYAFESTVTGCTGHDWDYDNWHTTRGSEGPHFKWETIRYDTMPALCAATGLECHGHEGAPGLTDPAGGEFTLLPSSPNIDRGVAIPGINDDYTGAGPDIGAYEAESAAHREKVFLPLIKNTPYILERRTTPPHEIAFCAPAGYELPAGVRVIGRWLVPQGGDGLFLAAHRGMGISHARVSGWDAIPESQLLPLDAYSGSNQCGYGAMWGEWWESGLQAPPPGSEITVEFLDSAGGIVVALAFTVNVNSLTLDRIDFYAGIVVGAGGGNQG